MFSKLNDLFSRWELLKKLVRFLFFKTWLENSGKCYAIFQANSKEILLDAVEYVKGCVSMGCLREGVETQIAQRRWPEASERYNNIYMYMQKGRKRDESNKTWDQKGEKRRQRVEFNFQLNQINPCDTTTSFMNLILSPYFLTFLIFNNSVVSSLFTI